VSDSGVSGWTVAEAPAGLPDAVSAVAIEVGVLTDRTSAPHCVTPDA
jgi:hypothetical protein